MIRTGKKFSKPEMSRVINGDTVLPESPEAPAKKRLDVGMTEIFKSYNRSTIAKFIKNGFVKVEGELVLKPNFLIEDGAKIELNVPEEMKNADVEPEVIFEDENVIVFNKPVGILSMAKNGYCPEKTMEDFGLLVHRLDRDTSGVMILAKNKETQTMLRRQFQDRRTHKTYFAILTGVPKIAEAKLELPIARDLKHPTTFRVDPRGKAAETYYKVLKSDGKHALVELKPISGRTHQLRVHMNYLEHPIVGDPVYGTEKGSRLYLHAGELEITLPGGIRKNFRAELPREFQEMFSNAKSENDSEAKEI